MQSISAARFLLICGLAFVFLYFGIDKLVHPVVWIGWMPPWMEGLGGFTSVEWLKAVAVGEIVIGVLMLIPFRALQKVGAFLAALHLIAVLTQTGWNDIAVRDIGLLFMAMSLLLLI